MAIKNLEKMDIYNPTNYVNNSEPDIDADNLNKTENKLEETVAKANEIIDALKTLISTVQTNSDNTVPSSSLAYAMQQEITKNKEDIATANSNLTQKTNTSDFNAFKNMIGFTGLSGINFGYDGTFVNIWWLFGTNKEFGHALNIKVSDGTLQFYNLINGSWQLAWTK